MVVDATKLKEEKRRQLALGALDWTHFWDERFRRARGHRLLEWTQGRVDSWEQEQLTSRGLLDQDQARVTTGWNDDLEKAATRFHEYCEQQTAKNANGWVDRAYLFFSVNEKVPTTLRMEAEREFHRVLPNLPLLLKAMGVHVRDVDQPHVLLREECQRRRGEETDFFERGVWRVENVTFEGGQYIWERWRLASLQQGWGDGTVPIWSQLGFGSKVKVFKKMVRDEIYPEEAKTYPRGPAHMDAPNNPWAWSCIVQVLQGHDVADQLVPAGQVDTVQGEDRDPRLGKHQPLWTRMWDQHGWLPDDWPSE